MRFGSTFSGIGGFELGLEEAGMICAWQAELDDKASGQLKIHWPNVPNHGDIRNVRRGKAEPIDLLCGGFPCQDLSVAGKRKGLDGERSGLFFEFVRLAEEFTPAWILLENVPGLLSSNEGQDFAIVLRRLGELGYGLAWRILDAQYFGVPQRRRRVYIVGHLAKRRRSVGKKKVQDRGGVSGLAAEVLFEREGVFWNPPARGEEREGSAGSPEIGFGESGQGYWSEGVKPIRAEGENRPSRPSTVIVDQDILATDLIQITNKQHGSRPSKMSQPLNTSGQMAVFGAFNADRDGGDAVDGISPPLTHKGDGDKAHSAYNKIGIYQFASGGGDDMKDTAQTLRAGAEHNYQILGPVIAPTVSSKWAKQAGGPAGDEVQNLVVDTNDSKSAGSRIQMGADVSVTLQGEGGGMAAKTGLYALPSGVRRLTPIECERLQGFPDDWTDGQSDSARYRQLGNAVAVPVVAWIGRRIVEVEARNAEA